MLDRGDAILRAVGDRLSLGELLCRRAEVEHRAGESVAAQAALSEAQDLATQLGAGLGSELGRALARTGELFEGAQ